MFLAKTLRRTMTRPSVVQRTSAIVSHIMQSSTATTAEPTVVFEENDSLRRYILNRPKKLNALDVDMINLLRPKLANWEASELCRVIVGSGAGKAFCAGGDVEAVVRDASDESTRQRAIDYFKDEFELDYQLATLKKPYVSIMDGVTMGGGVGLSGHAPFRIATEKTNMAMPETKIGYCPDVGANFLLSRLDGELGTYLALTGLSLHGRAVFEHGIATHFVPSRRIAPLLSALAALENPTLDQINGVIEEHYDAPLADEPRTAFTGARRAALDAAFAHSSVDGIVEALERLANAPGSDLSDPASVAHWAQETLTALHLRSPTSLRVALEAVRRGKVLTLAEVLQMELGIATAFICGASPDFTTGVTAVLIERQRDGRPAWSPGTLAEVAPEDIQRDFFSTNSPFLAAAPKLQFAHDTAAPGSLPRTTLDTVGPIKYALPTEHEIGLFVRGEHTQSSDVGYSLEQLVARFVRSTGRKHGVETKIREVAARRCVVAEDPDKHHCLRWKN